MNMTKTLLAIALTSLASLASASTLVTVYAAANSISPDINLASAPLDTGVFVNAGQVLTITASGTWAIGTGDPAYSSDANGGLFGWIFPVLNPNGSHSGVSYGALIGEIGNGDWFFVGTNFSQSAADTGQLRLAYVDSNAFDNVGAVQASISAIPEPGSVVLVGLGLAAFALTRRKAA
jgi:hypothetical protein